MAKLPESIDKYPVEELIAVGGMGEVYRAVHPTLDRPVILKKLSIRGNQSVRERFKREARVLMEFRNDNTVHVYDHFIQGRSHYIVMEYVDGPSVRELIQRERYIAPVIAAAIALGTAKALQYAHSRGIVHRDVKPANVLLSRAGEVKLADFGIASSRMARMIDGEESGDQTLTDDGTTLGTPAYMAPEQFENSRTVDARADIYSLGVMMYEMLSGRKPFKGGFSPDVIQNIQKGRCARLGSLVPGIPRILQRIVRQCMKTSLKSRPGTLDGVIAELERFLRRYTSESVQAALCAIAADEDLPLFDESRRRRNGRRLRRVIPIIVLLGIASGYVTGTREWAMWVAASENQRVVFTANVVTDEISQSRGSRRLFGGEFASVNIISEDGAFSRAIPMLKINQRNGSTYHSLPTAIPGGTYRLQYHWDGGETLEFLQLGNGRNSGWIHTVHSDIASSEQFFQPSRVEVYDAQSGRDLGDMLTILDTEGRVMYRGTAAEIPREAGIEEGFEAASWAEVMRWPGTIILKVPGYETQTITTISEGSGGELQISAAMYRSK